ncbi:MAG TPA: hypothetical protein VLU25_02800 [Acidobacteriota bacterium]|nr:hypothetical protein [Acidobacteriota bacterium]
MSEYIRFARVAILWLVVMFILRLLLGIFEVPYEEGTSQASLVLTTLFACIFLGAFGRRLRGYGVLQAALLGITIAFVAQVLIIAGTAGSYLLGAETYFNHPKALNTPDAVGVVQAMVIRVVGMLVNMIIGAIAAMLGWLSGKLVPEPGA